MDYEAYHSALNFGYSEAEATRIGEDAYFDKMSDSGCIVLLGGYK